MNREILVYIDLAGKPEKIGRLWTRVRAGKETASFEYEKAWLKNPDRFALEPSLSLTGDSFHSGTEKTLFGAVGDSAPDRWGRMLMRRSEERNAKYEGRQTRTLFESDFLLMVDDETRQGALRFKIDENGVFLANNPTYRIPPVIELPRLLAASERFIEENESDEDLKLLLAPGSSLGGARPKASVLDLHGNLSIAKFPAAGDEFDVVSWESVALEMARRCGITVSDWHLESINGKKVLVVRRFDRWGSIRLPFLSAMSMLSARDNETRSYLEIADSLRMHGAEPQADLVQLWRRLVFNVLISNTDDHLRNHGFLFQSGNGWRLSPAYDLNPTPLEIKSRFLSTAIGLDDTAASLELALETAGYYGLSDKNARVIAKEIAQVTQNWELHAIEIGISKSEVKRMASAFEHAELSLALSLV